MIGLTPKQADFVRVIAELGAVLNRPPSYREAMQEMDQRSPSSVRGLADRLRERGWLAPGPKLRLLRDLPAAAECAIEITDAGRAYLEVRHA